MGKSIGWLLDTMHQDFFEKMQREGYVRDTGQAALNEYGEVGLGYEWLEWWDAGDE
jgi:hypothetical protein